MTEIVRKIADISETLSAEAQRALLDMAEALARSGPQAPGFIRGMSAAQRADLEQALGEARRGDLVDDAALDRELDALFARKP